MHLGGNSRWVPLSLCLIKTLLNFTSNFLDQSDPKSKYQCKSELIYIRDFEVVQKLAVCIIRLKPDDRNRSFLKHFSLKVLDKNAIFLDVFTGCFESFKNERSLTRNFTITASSERTSHIASYSRLYGTDGWCSSSPSLPQYLQADFNQIVTVTGVATQGDNKTDNRVTSYLIRYGYDGKTWISYGAGQVNLQHVFIYLCGFA